MLTSHGYPPTVSGVTLVVQRLARALVERGHQVTVLAGSDRFAPYETYDRGVHVVRLESRPNPYWPANPVPRLSVEDFERQVARRSPDVVHCHDALPFCMRAVRSRHHLLAPLMATCHYYPSFVASYLTSAELTNEIIEELTWRYSIALYNRVGEVVFATATHRDHFVQRGLTAKTHVISNGVDVHRYSPAVEPEDAVWATRLPAGPRILAVGRLAQDKNLEVLINAIANVRSEPHAHLLLVGEGPHQEALEAAAEEAHVSPFVHFLGFVPEMELPGLYRSCDAFAISSNHEVQSLPALQAAATGLPIVAAAQGSLPEICVDGENGLLVRTESPEDFAVALSGVLEPATAIRMGLASLGISRLHDERLTFDAYESLYKGLTSKPSPGLQRAEMATSSAHE